MIKFYCWYSKLCNIHHPCILGMDTLKTTSTSWENGKYGLSEHTCLSVYRDPFLPLPPVKIIKSGKYNRMPILIGHTRNEGSKTSILPSNLTIIIIGEVWNTEFDTSVCVHSMPKWLSQRWKLWCVLLVYGMYKVFTLSFFWLMHFPLSSNQNEKGCFPDNSSERHSACCAFAEF